MIDLTLLDDLDSSSKGWSLEEDILLARYLQQVINQYGLDHGGTVTDKLAIRLYKNNIIKRPAKGIASRFRKMHKSLNNIGSEKQKVLKPSRITAVKKELEIK